MGYMGFGMSKESYSRKPREGFKKISKILDKERIHISESEIETKEFTKEEKQKVVAMILENRKRGRIRNIVAGIIAVVLLIFVVFFLKNYWNIK